MFVYIYLKFSTQIFISFLFYFTVICLQFTAFPRLVFKACAEFMCFQLFPLNINDRFLCKSNNNSKNGMCVQKRHRARRRKCEKVKGIFIAAHWYAIRLKP